MSRDPFEQPDSETDALGHHEEPEESRGKYLERIREARWDRLDAWNDQMKDERMERERGSR